MVADYFLRLGTLVCEGLNKAGYYFCRGEVMASNPRWCRSLPEWLTGFTEWVEKAEPQEIINFCIFFDFRTVYGDKSLSNTLRQTIHTTLQNSPAFFNLLAQNALNFKPPIRLPGNKYLSGSASEHSGEINLKDVMMPLVSFARLYVLQHDINQTHTLARINALEERNIIHKSSHDEVISVYEFLMHLRLKSQLDAIQSGLSPTNFIHPGKLGDIQREMLKQSFDQIAAVQKKISYDFLGGI